METTTKEKKKTSLDLRSEAHELQAEIEKLLRESHGEVTEEIDELFVELADLETDMVKKIESLQWASLKVKAQIEAAKAIKKFYSEEAKKEGKTVNARQSNLESVKDLVAMNLHTLDQPEIRLSNGKKVYLRKFYSASVEDEPAAYTALQGTDIMQKQVVLEDHSAEQVGSAIVKVLDAIQTPDGEPVALDPEIHTALMSALDELGKAESRYSVDGKALNTEVERLHGEFIEKYQPVLGELKSLSNHRNQISVAKGETPPEVQQEIDEIDERIGELQKKADEIESTYTIAGVTFSINESVFGL